MKTPTSLRDRAEAAWRDRHKDCVEKGPEDLARAVHELEVHQIELEVQNEELRAAQRELEDSRQQFSNLYDFAPVGYLTIDRGWIVVQANLTLAKIQKE